MMRQEKTVGSLSSSTSLAGSQQTRYQSLPLSTATRLLPAHIDVVLVLAVAGLVLATAAERVSFKMSVDKMTPFRLLLTESIFVSSLLIYGFIAIFKKAMGGVTQQPHVTAQMHQFPQSKLLLMAVLDTVQFSCLVASAPGVTPTMTVILLHTSTPVIVLGSRLLFPDRVYTDLQLQGVALISIAIIIAFLQQFWLLYSRGTSDQLSGALSNFLYVIGAAMQGASTLYKEKCVIEWSQPIDLHFLSTWLFFYQILVCLLLAPVIYLLQGVSSGGANSKVGFPLNAMFVNVRDGWTCVMGQNTVYSQGDDGGGQRVEGPYDTGYEDCECSMWLILAYVVSNLLVLACIDRVLQTGVQSLGRATALAVLVAFVALGVYDMQFDTGDELFGTNISSFDIVSVAALLVGMELYGRDPEPCSEVVV